MKNKIINVVLLFALTLTLIITSVKYSEKDRELGSLKIELDHYRYHHQPVEGWYYKAEAISGKSDTELFIICTNFQPERQDTGAAATIGFNLKKNGSLVELEVPRKSVGAEAGVGKYFTVKVIDGISTTIYFATEAEVIQHSLNT